MGRKNSCIPLGKSVYCDDRKRIICVKFRNLFVWDISVVDSDHSLFVPDSVAAHLCVRVSQYVVNE